jgi:hypothetical protein
MAQAERPIITRRSLVAATASAVAAVPLSALAAAPDPVFALIAAHKAACLRHERVCRLLSALEGQIPDAKRQEWFREDWERASARTTIRAGRRAKRSIGRRPMPTMRRRGRSRTHGL